MVGSYILHPFRPRLRIYWTETRALFSFSKHVFLGGILMFLRGSLASLLLGKLLGTSALGYYSLAQSLVSRPVVVISAVFGNVLYPAFSRLQDRVQVLRRAFVRALGVGCLALGPVLVGTAVTAYPMVRVFYGKGWEPVAPISMLYCLVQFILFLQRPAGIVLAARGKPGLTNIGKVLYPFIFVPLVIPLAFHYQTLGVVAALGAAAAGELAVLMLLACRDMSVSLLDVGRGIAGPTLASILMGAGVWSVGSVLTLPAVPTLAILVPLGVVLYALASVVVNRNGWADALRAVGSAGPAAPEGKLAAGGVENA
jgi:O-antigen/teichoic acid export membrane protein